MPWTGTTPMDLRTQFIADYLRQIYSITDLCAMYSISRKTGYKWIDRYLTHGPSGLDQLSARPKQSPKLTSPFIANAIIDVRIKHPTWGAKKILPFLAKRYPDWTLPARSTIYQILGRNGMIQNAPKRRHLGHPGKPTSQCLAPNDTWCVDFKGQFKTGDGQYCYPLTITDNFSRFLLGCQSLRSTRVVDAIPVFTRVFKEYGLPNIIRSDNGVPFATNGLARLSELSAWWVRLGILPELIEPGKPQQNGRHERMHKTLKAETTKPTGSNLSAQQRKFNRFIEEFNFVRPHEALDMATPSEIYTYSNRPMPTKLPTIEYPDRFEKRYVSANGGIRWNNQWVNLTSACIGQYVGLEEIDNGVWDVYFGVLKLGRFHEQFMRIEDVHGKLRRS
jgi:putative transposase